MKEKLYTGTSKTLYKTEEHNSLLLSFDDRLIIKGNKSIIIAGKGAINNSISAFIMEKLGLIGIDNHFIKKNNMYQQLVRFVNVFPFKIYISTIAGGRYVKDFAIEDGFVFDTPMIDYRIKNSKINYPVINESQIISFGWVSHEEMRLLKNQAMRIHDFVSGLFMGIDIRLIEIQLEFGRLFNEEDLIIMLVDEISPDTCKLWDVHTNEKLCYEIAKDNPDNVILVYQEVLKRLRLNNNY